MKELHLTNKHIVYIHNINIEEEDVRENKLLKLLTSSSTSNPEYKRQRLSEKLMRYMEIKYSKNWRPAISGKKRENKLGLKMPKFLAGKSREGRQLYSASIRGKRGRESFEQEGKKESDLSRSLLESGSGATKNSPRIPDGNTNIHSSINMEAKRTPNREDFYGHLNTRAPNNQIIQNNGDQGKYTKETPNDTKNGGFQTAGNYLNKYKGKGGRRDSEDSDDQHNQKVPPGFRKKFVPPYTKPKDEAITGRFDPGKSVFTHMTKGKSKTTRKKSESEGEEEIDERLKGLDPKLIELVENEILDSKSKLTWNEIAGLQFAKKTIHEVIVWPLLRPDLFQGLRRPPKGILLFGPPGTGKTMIGKAIASECKSTFFNISASSLTSKWVGEGEKMVRTLFGLAKYHQPSVVFIDEIDSLLSARSEGDFESSRRIKTEFLVQLDGVGCTDADQILIIGATNRPQELDEAVKRRMVKRMYIPLPNPEAREQFLETILSTQTPAPSLSKGDIQELVLATRGYSGADLKSLCAEAAMYPIRHCTDILNIRLEDIRALGMDDFKEAMIQVKATVCQNDLVQYKEWNEKFGSFPFTENELI